MEHGGTAVQNGRKFSFWRMIPVLAFGIPALIMLIIFIINGIYPFGDRSFLFSDMYHQYMPFFSEFMRKIRAGEGLSYSWNVGIGSNFLALYVYYLASPLHWLALLAPERFLMEFMSYLVIIKIGLCGLTFCIYLRSHFQDRKEAGALFFSCFYALSGFLAAYNWNIMWLDCVVLLPLIVLGLEQLVKEGKCTLYCLSLGLSIFTNYYISIMICIFLVLYFLVLLLVEKRSWRILWHFAFYSLLAGGMAAVLLVPEVCAILVTDFGDMDFPDTLKSYFSVLDMLARHCMCVYTERGLDHWPNIYCGSAVFLLLPMYVLNQKIGMRRRFGYLALAGLMLIGFSTNVLDFIWHGLNYPDSLPGRQSFIYILLVLTMCYGAYRKVREVQPRQILYGYLGAVIFLLFCEKFVDHEDFETGVELLNLLFVTMYAVLLYLHRTRKDKWLQQVLMFTALVVVVAESGINTYCTSVGTTSRSQYLDELTDYQSLYETARLDALKQQSDGAGQPFFRMEKFSRKTKNDGTLAGYPTASVFSSTMNSYVMDLYKRLGMRHSKVYYGFDGATFFTSALLNVQYMYGEDGQEEGPLYSHMADSGDISLYQAAAALPFGYMAPSGYDLPEGYSNNGLELQNQMVRELGAEGVLFTRKQAKENGDDVSFTADSDGYYYGLLTASGTKKMKVSGSGEESSYGDLKKGSVLYLGYLKEGASVTLTNGDDSDDTPKIKADIYRMDQAVLMQALAVLGASHLEQVSFDSTHISGEITLKEPGRLILSVPYEKGWTVMLDGEETEPGLFGGTLMAFELEAGQHTISMHYIPYGRNAGIVISVICIGIFIVIQSYGYKKNKKRRIQKDEDYGAGGSCAAGGYPTGRAGECPGAGTSKRDTPGGSKKEKEQSAGCKEDSAGGGGITDHGSQPEKLCEDGRTDTGRL